MTLHMSSQRTVRSEGEMAKVTNANLSYIYTNKKMRRKYIKKLVGNLIKFDKV